MTDFPKIPPEYYLNLDDEALQQLELNIRIKIFAEHDQDINLANFHKLVQLEMSARKLPLLVEIVDSASNVNHNYHGRGFWQDVKQYPDPKALRDKLLLQQIDSDKPSLKKLLNTKISDEVVIKLNDNIVVATDIAAGESTTVIAIRDDDGNIKIVC